MSLEQLTKAFDGLQNNFTETKDLIVIENFTLAQNTTPVNLLSNPGLHAMKALNEIKSVSFTLAPYMEEKLDGKYPQDFVELIHKTYNNRQYADWITHINKNTEFVIAYCNQLDCEKEFVKGKYGHLLKAISIVDLIFVDTDLNLNVRNFQPAIEAIAKEAHRNIWGYIHATIHPIQGNKGYALRLTVSGRGVSSKSALEIWAKSIERITI